MIPRTPLSQFDQTVDYPEKPIKMKIVSHTLQCEMVKLLRNPNKYINQLTFSKEFRGLGPGLKNPSRYLQVESRKDKVECAWICNPGAGNYSSAARIGSMKIANDRLQIDPGSVPLPGSS